MSMHLDCLRELRVKLSNYRRFTVTSECPRCIFPVLTKTRNTRESEYELNLHTPQWICSQSHVTVRCECERACRGDRERERERVRVHAGVPVVQSLNHHKWDQSTVVKIIYLQACMYAWMHERTLSVHVSMRVWVYACMRACMHTRISCAFMLSSYGPMSNTWTCWYR